MTSLGLILLILILIYLTIDLSSLLFHIVALQRQRKVSVIILNSLQLSTLDGITQILISTMSKHA